MTTSAPRPNPVQDSRILLKELQNQFPVFEKCQPLALGIDKQILARLPEVDRKLLRIALSIHTKSTRYLKEMSKATARVDLDGNEAGEIKETHRTHAAELLEERLKKIAEQRRAQREEEIKRRREEEADRRRADKLNQLAAKFSRSAKKA